MAVDLILGTAGHVDHGKTSLIRALTGVDTDRLPEEKRRGITIDLGFAQMAVGEARLGIVDVPGHERFIRNMLAGATGMDLAMLIVAADEGVKQQTREHLEILRLLDLRGGVIVITKADLASAEWIELVEEEIRELARGTVLERAEIIRTSAVSGAGLDELRAALARVADGLSASRGQASQPFRMAIDRTFTVAGHGTVVTGSVGSGRAIIGDELVIEPGGVSVRVRGLHHHDQPAQEVWRGQRAAVNLVGVHHDQIRRGQELTSPGFLRPSKLLTAHLALLADAPDVRSRTRLRVHVGTAEVLATAALLDRAVLRAGESAPVQLFLAEPAVATWNQPVVVRSESPMRTIGGGRVLDPCAVRLRKPGEHVLAHLERLHNGEVAARAAASLFFAGWRGWELADLPRLAGCAADEALGSELGSRGELVEIRVSPVRRLRVHIRVLEDACDLVAEFLSKLHAREPLKLAFSRGTIAAGFTWLPEAAVLDAIIARLQAAGRVTVSPQGVALAGKGPKLSRAEQTLLADLSRTFREAGLAAPSLAECQQRAGRQAASVPQLLKLAAAAGELVAISAELWLHTDTERAAREKVAAAMAQRGGLTVSDIRELLGTTRKYAVPLCEYWDHASFTVRSGDVRRLRGQTTEDR